MLFNIIRLRKKRSAVEIGSYNEAKKGEALFKKIFNELGLEEELNGDRSQENLARMDDKFDTLFTRLEKEWNSKPKEKEKKP